MLMAKLGQINLLALFVHVIIAFGLAFLKFLRFLTHQFGSNLVDPLIQLGAIFCRT